MSIAALIVLAVGAVLVEGVYLLHRRATRARAEYRRPGYVVFVRDDLAAGSDPLAGSRILERRLHQDHPRQSARVTR